MCQTLSSMALDLNQQTFVSLWLRLEDTRASLLRDYRRFCINNIMAEWAKEGIIRIGDPTPGRPRKPSEDDVKQVCDYCERSAWDELQPPKLNKTECSRLLRIIVAIQHELTPVDIDFRMITKAYKIAFGRQSAPIPSPSPRGDEGSGHHPCGTAAPIPRPFPPRG